MREHERHQSAITASEAMYNLWELEGRQQDVDLDRMMMRLQDLSAYSLTHAEILDQREGVELLALAMFFGATTDPRFHRNQTRLSSLSEQAANYQGKAETIEQEVKLRNTRNPQRRTKRNHPEAIQPRLF